MRLLLDTQVAVWALKEPERIGIEGRKLIADSGNAVYVSVVSIWEIANKRALGRSSAPPFTSVEAVRFFEEAGYLMLAVTAAHAAVTEQLPLLHKDPFDRLLVAQAITEPLRLLTQDSAVAAYDPGILRV